MTIGHSRAHTFRIDGPGVQGREGSSGEHAFYLKIAPAGDLVAEHERTVWLAAHLPVPRVVAFVSQGGYDFLLTTALPGRDAATLRETMPPGTIVDLLAAGLKQVHHVPIAACPFDRRLAVTIEKARHNVVHGLVDEDDFDAVRAGRSADDLFEELIRRRPASEDLVFTHGDYCLPNIILAGRMGVLRGNLNGRWHKRSAHRAGGLAVKWNPNGRTLRTR